MSPSNRKPTSLLAKCLPLPFIAPGSFALQPRMYSAGAIAIAIALTGCIESTDEPDSASSLNCSPEPMMAQAPEAPYTADPQSLATHEIPDWYADARFGIMIHWGLYSVPGWAETTLDPADWNTPESLSANSPEWYRRNPYAEWYANTIQIEGSEAQAHHRAKYGDAFAYDNFRSRFEQQAASWDPQAWADLFATAGAHYVILVTKHHDGYLMWPTDVEHPYRSNWSSSQDFVGELSAAVRTRCMRMGLYYSGGIDWSFEAGVIRDLTDFIFAQPEQPEYAAYADAQWRELIAKYRPAILWNDIRYPEAAAPLELFAHYYNTVPDGVVNDRWSTLVPGAIHHDVRSEEYQSSPGISGKRFETIRGIGRSFGYNRNEDAGDYLSIEDLVFQFVDIVSKNGNLVLNVGPTADGTIPREQVARLQTMGRWLATNGEAYFGSEPWVRAEGRTRAGQAVRFTRGKGNGMLYATVVGTIANNMVAIEAIPGDPSNVRLLGFDLPLSWYSQGDTLHIALPEIPPQQPAYAFAISGLDE